MERYTEWSDGHGCGQRGKDCYTRLARYEDTGLEPEEIHELLHQSYGPLHKKLGEWIGAEQDGRLVVLPCKKGDRLWSFCDFPDIGVSGVFDFRVDSVFAVDGAVWVKRDRGIPHPADDIGKTAFRTREEAEAALAARKEGHGQT